MIIQTSIQVKKHNKPYNTSWFLWIRANSIIFSHSAWILWCKCHVLMNNTEMNHQFMYQTHSHSQYDFIPLPIGPFFTSNRREITSSIRISGNWSGFRKSANCLIISRIHPHVPYINQQNKKITNSPLSQSNISHTYVLCTPSFWSTRKPCSWYSALDIQNDSLSFIMSASTAPPRNTMCFRRGGSSIRILNFCMGKEKRIHYL